VIAHISSRIIVNKAAMKMKYDRINDILARLRLAVEASVS
jgi:ATP phosphoribosyltransferase